MSLRPRFYCLFILFLQFGCFGYVRGQSSRAITYGKEYSVFSPLLKEERQYLVSLPESYEGDEFYTQKRYPVLVLLDADTHFQYASSMIQFLSAGASEQIPEMIIVAIRNTSRMRDMTSGLTDSDSFLNFLEKELLPQIDQQYRTLPYRILAGHSLAGLFTLTCFLQQRAFHGYLAVDPTLTWNNGAILSQATSLLKEDTPLKARLYLAQAANPFEPGPSTGERGKAFGSFVKALKENRSPKFSFQHTYYEKENHFSVPVRSLLDGLLFLFNAYEFPFSTFIAQGSTGVWNHYQQLSSQYGLSLPPPGKVINQAGLFMLHQQKQVDKAFDLLKLNELYFPDSPVVQASLGQAYRVKGDTANAILHYRKVIALKGTDEQARKAIAELTHQP